MAGKPKSALKKILDLFLSLDTEEKLRILDTLQSVNAVVQATAAAAPAARKKTKNGRRKKMPATAETPAGSPVSTPGVPAVPPTNEATPLGTPRRRGRPRKGSAAPTQEAQPSLDLAEGARPGPPPLRNPPVPS
jgi:uncharacterized membrane protein